MRPPISSGTVFIKDPVDKWNKEQTIGLAEHAVRTQFPYIYNKSGNVVLWDDFESPTIKPYVNANNSGSCNRSTDASLTGDFSMKFVTGNVADNYCYATYYINNFRSGKIGLLANLMTHDVQVEYELDIIYYDGSTKHAGRVKVDVSDGKVYYGYPTTSTHIDTISWYTSGDRNLFIPIKLVIDIDNDKYDNLYIARNKIDMSNYDLYTESTSTNQHIETWIWFYTKANVSYTSYMDNVVITDNEP